ncbi:MAG: hypothetical protein ACI9GW_001942 [Halieaceae bacterium]|jgi:hypothetical protein
MGQGYQDRDYELIDYQLFELDGFARPFRGPRPVNLDPGCFGICIGAAQTFGCYATQPYPKLLSNALDFPLMNLGVAGAGPSFFLRRPHFLKMINQSRFAVLQIMSGRSESNSLLESTGGEMLLRRSDQVRLGAAPAWQELLDSLSFAELDELVAETQGNWLRNMHQLLAAIKVPTILFWFSERPPDYEQGYGNVHELFGAFPQLVDRSMMRALTADYSCIELVSSVGLPQSLTSRFSGEATSIIKRADLGGGQKEVNNYYPSPEMHVLAFEKLLSACQKLMEVR